MHGRRRLHSGAARGEQQQRGDEDHDGYVEMIAGVARVVVVDAAYEWLAEAPWAASSLLAEAESVVVLHSLTKLFAMPGLRLGYVLASPALAAEIRGRQPPWPVGAGEIAARLAALGAFEDRLASVPILHQRRRALEAAFAVQGARTSRSTANFLLAEVGDGARFGRAMLTHGFFVRDASSFALPGWARLAVPAERHMPRLLEAIAAGLVASHVRR